MEWFIIALIIISFFALTLFIVQRVVKAFQKEAEYQSLKRQVREMKPWWDRNP